jgi:iron(III) transport system substrate-binding protein
MINSRDEEQQAAAARVGIYWPNQNTRGTHINVSGAGVTAAASNPEAALALIEFLANDDSQRWYAETNNEYPVRDTVEPSDLLKSWGSFKADQVPMAELGRLNAEAVKAMDRANWR